MLDLCGFKGLLLLFRLSASYLIYFAPLPSGEKNKPAYTALITTAFSYLGVLLVSPFKSMVVDFFSGFVFIITYNPRYWPLGG